MRRAIARSADSIPDAARSAATPVGRYGGHRRVSVDRRSQAREGRGESAPAADRGGRRPRRWRVRGNHGRIGTAVQGAPDLGGDGLRADRRRLAGRRDPDRGRDPEPPAPRPGDRIEVAIRDRRRRFSLGHVRESGRRHAHGRPSRHFGGPSSLERLRRAGAVNHRGRARPRLVLARPTSRPG